MAVVARDEWSRWDAVLDSLGLLIEVEAENPYLFDGPDTFVERQDTGEQFDENKLDSRYWGSNRSWHEGAGQKRLQVPNVSSAFRFFSSKGINISTKSEATLLHETAQIYANTYTTRQQRLLVANDALWTNATPDNIRKITDVNGTGSNFATGATASDHVEDMATDGSTVYLALGSHGVHRILPGGSSPAVHWSDADVVRIAWVKNRLLGLGLTGGRYQLLEVDATTGSVQKHLFAQGETPAPCAMVELGPLVYIAMLDAGSSSSRIYAWDGTNAPFLALPLPPGDAVESMTPFLGAGMLIGATQPSEDKADAGIVYAGFPTGQGHLTLLEREVAAFGRTDSNTARRYAIYQGASWSNEVYFPWPYDDGGGIGVYLPETAAYARHLYSSVVDQVEAVAVWRGRRFFTVHGSGVWGERTTFVASGNLVSSLIDINVDAEKTWILQESGFDPLPTGTSVTHEYSTDGGTTWAGSATGSTAGSRLLSSNPFVVAHQIQYRVTLTANGAKTLTPTLLKSGVGGWPASKPGAVHQLTLRAFPAQQRRSGEIADGQDNGWSLFNALDARRRAGAIYDYQPPWWALSEDSLKVRVAGVRTLGAWGTSGVAQGGTLLLTLKEVE